MLEVTDYPGNSCTACGDAPSLRNSCNTQLPNGWQLMLSGSQHWTMGAGTIFPSPCGEEERRRVVSLQGLFAVAVRSMA